MAYSTVLAVPSQGSAPAPRPRSVWVMATVAAIVLAVVAGIAIWLGLPAPFGGTGGTPDPTEAIDLSSATGLGPAWSPADDDLLGAVAGVKPVVTPCGVLVIVAAPAKISGYEIKTGHQLWSHVLPDVTGMTNPTITLEDPTYSSDCHMLLPLSDDSETDPTRRTVVLIVDLHSGTVQTHSGHCEAAGDKWAGCLYRGEHDLVVEAINLTDLSTVWEAPASYTSGSYRGGRVVAGKIWSEQGYRDPATGDVVFGADVHTGTSLKNGDPSVVYIEPVRPGPYSSGLALRLSGELISEADSQCQVVAWNTKTDVALWSKPVSLTCGMSYYEKWTVASQTLLVTSIGQQPGTQAFAWADGRQMWEKDAHQLEFGWDHKGVSLGTTGVAEGQVWFSDNRGQPQVVRITDGATMTMPTCSDYCFPVATSPNMAYMVGEGSGGVSLMAYALNQRSPTAQPSQLWSTTITNDPAIADHMGGTWTFATGGTMYVVYGQYGGNKLRIAPILTR